ncbi:hypothetical protein ACS0TY_023041 [Phlomoides rotata]
MFMAKPSSKFRALLPLILVLLSLVFQNSLHVSSKDTTPTHNYFPTRKESSSYSSHMNDERETTLHNSHATTASSKTTSKKKTHDFFRAAAHEVPSGPNPESN